VRIALTVARALALEVMRDPANNVDTRLTAARSAAPFVHPKLASVELSGHDGGPIEHKDASEEARLEAFMAFLARTKGNLPAR
jgi:hypothetical protein